MRFYESVFIARQDISTTQAEALADTFAALIEGAGGKIAKREYWGLRKLAYKVNKNRKGHYVLFNMEAPSDAIKEMERQMRLHEDVLRYLTTRLEAIDPEPSVMMQAKSGRDDDRKGGRGRDFGDRREPRSFKSERPADTSSEGDDE
ncbi:MAG: 30S ribosomal protein S6 [Rhodospirillales bacterium]|nr:30S ribosomal protein S6 [Rhodospirillales bacterium]MCW8952883.1 30S ribosomal protein S6 [Rhodospirillales bacterium]MCW8969695.1 30S ribosomal protein S6 [Rhodospirillales bacterium]MCW9002475.1 30S ribosomal protein S6 [Rhodospirillales bacterium]MCW9039721.1 30S ribosomal protein S6 [Rhodospirillales bacterium]